MHTRWRFTVSTKDHKSIDLPVRADPVQGGFVVNTSSLTAAHLEDSLQGALHGYWGFEKYDGPSFRSVNTRAQAWELAPGDQGALIVGREDVVHLRAGNVACIDRIVLKDPGGKELKAAWRAVNPNEVEVRLPLQAATPGPLTLDSHSIRSDRAAVPRAARLLRGGAHRSLQHPCR